MSKLDPKVWYYTLRPQYPGKIGCGIRFFRSARGTKDTYRTPAARARRAARAEYRRAYSHVAVLGVGAGRENEGKKIRVWSKSAPGFKAWLKRALLPEDRPLVSEVSK